MWNLNYDTNEHIYSNRFTNIENRLVVGVGEEGKEWEFRTSRCKLVYIGWINNKVSV